MDEVDNVYPGIGLPPVDQVLDESRTIDDLLNPTTTKGDLSPETSLETPEADTANPLNTVLGQLVEVGRALRSGDEPRSPLYVLLYADDLTAGQIAGKLHTDPRDIYLSLEALVELGWVSRRIDNADRRARYSFIGLAGY